MATHIIASTLPPKKTVDFSRYRIVKPGWIVDSVTAGKLLPWTEYRVLDEGPRQKVLKFGSDGAVTQQSPEARRGYKEQTDNSFYTSQLKDHHSPASRSQGPDTSTLQSADKRISSRVLENPSAESSHTTTKPPVPAFEDTKPMTPAKAESASDASLHESPSKQMTSEEHNAWLLSDPRLRKSSTANPDFLKQFYSESRLHHLSTWKANIKSSMQRLATERGLSQKKFKKRPGARGYVFHVDFDSFFCAVSLKQHPGFEDKPAVVAHSSGPGSEIASCNYPARSFGVKNGMWMKKALELCPDLKVVPYDFPAYEEASRLFYEAIMTVGGVVQSVSIDEALVDATAVVYSASGSQGMGVDEGNLWVEQQKADEIAQNLRNIIKSKTGCHVSVGIGGNILQAKVALRKAKPAGQYQLKPDDVLSVIGELTVEQLPGVSYSIGGKLEDLGIKFVKDIRDVSRERLTAALGPKTSEKLSEYARGIDKAEVGEQPPRKSVSAEVSWGIRFINQEEAEEFVHNICKELEKRLLNEQVRGKHLTVKIMRRSLDAPLDPAKHLGHGKCDTFNKSATFGVATNDGIAISKEAVAILRSYKFSPGDLRGIGVQMTKLEPMKAVSTGFSDGSQRTLSFGAFAGPPSAKKTAKAEPIDDIESPQKPVRHVGSDIGQDPIADDPLTPRKPKIHPAMALSKAGQDDARANTPLNVSGTQFIIPSNPDPAVLAELPNDIRSKLMGQGQRSAQAGPSRKQTPSRPESPDAGNTLPSQIDAEVFNALPDDMKAEVLASYGRTAASAQAPLGTSPRNPALGQTRKQISPAKRAGFRSLFGKPQRQRDANAGVVQTSFKRKQGDESPASINEIEELDAEFLAELPEDVRKEVIVDHRRRRMAARSGLDAPFRRHHTPDADVALPGGQMKIHFPAPPAKVQFASSGVTATKEIKDMLDAWHSETQQDGPHSGDVQVFETYLARVVKEEKDLEKAAELIRWLDIIVEHDSTDGRGKESWRVAAAQIRNAVQDSVRERGLGPLDI